jgi:fatty acid desaturase
MLLALDVAMIARRPVAWSELLVHIVRIVATTATLALVARCSVLLALATGSLLFLASFAFMHDVTHGSLKLPARANGIVLSLAGGMMLMSGHALRRSHLHHHKRPLASDDVEGESATRAWWSALLTSPRDALRWTRGSYARAHAEERPMIIAETCITTLAALALVVSGVGALQCYAAAALFMRATMSFWAGHIPHRTPPIVARIALPFARSGSVIAKSLVHHELHHRSPSIPCARLDAQPSIACVRM